MTHMTKALLIDDDQKLGDLLKNYLEKMIRIKELVEQLLHQFI